MAMKTRTIQEVYCDNCQALMPASNATPLTPEGKPAKPNTIRLDVGALNLAAALMFTTLEDGKPRGADVCPVCIGLATNAVAAHLSAAVTPAA